MPGDLCQLCTLVAWVGPPKGWGTEVWGACRAVGGWGAREAFLGCASRIEADWIACLRSGPYYPRNASSETKIADALAK